MRLFNLEAELRKSKSIIQSITGQEPCALAYPYGFYDAQVISKVRKHFKCAFTCADGNGNWLDNLFAIRRILITQNTPLDKLEELIEQ